MISERKNTEPPLKHDAFWHLQAIGLLEPSNPEQPVPPLEDRKETETWGKLADAPEALVAMIDTGVSMHPYLADKLLIPDQDSGRQPATGTGSTQDLLNIHHNFDLTAAPSLPANSVQLAKFPADFWSDDWLIELGLHSRINPKPYQIIIKKLVDDNKDKIAFDSGAPATSNSRFSAHGTSCAGIVVASSKNDPKETPNRPYYRGVDPGSRLMSITTSFSPRSDLLTMAFLLAASKNADVILFPRGLPREILGKKGVALEDDWQALKETIIAVSKTIPVVCAAGNESVGELIAPARFAAKDNGIIAVAAMNYYGYRSSYSNFGEGITVAAPSDDAEIFNRDQARFDKTDRFYTDYPYEFFVEKSDPTIQPVPYGEASIRSIDVAGAFGFSDTDTDVTAKLSTEPGSFFTDFGGTSAAASIVAGVAALIQRANKKRNGGKRLDGLAVRKLIKETALRKDAALPHLPGVKLAAGIVDGKLAADNVDGRDLGFEESFGAGLVAAGIAVKAIADGWKP